MISLKVTSIPRINARAILEEPMRAYLDAVVAAGLSYLDTVVPVDSGDTRESFHESGGVTSITGSYPRMQAVIGTSRPYAGMLNAGGRRGPGKAPPVKNIQRWLSRKGMDTRMAYGIARKIAKKGTVTGPNYEEGSFAGLPVRGYFGMVEVYVESAMQQVPMQRFVADVKSRWTR